MAGAADSNPPRAVTEVIMDSKLDWGNDSKNDWGNDSKNDCRKMTSELTLQVRSHDRHEALLNEVSLITPACASQHDTMLQHGAPLNRTYA